MKLLLVDDEWITREGIMENTPWASLGIDQVEEAEDGVQALTEAERLSPDILLTDVRMPRMNGTELAHRVRQLYPRCYIIFMSGYTDKAYMKAAINVSATAYVEKPIDLAELHAAIGKAVLSASEDRKLDEIRKLLLYKQGDRAAKNPAVAEMVKYIEANYEDERLSLKQISQHMYLTPSYLCVLFKEEMNVTIHQYLTRIRIERAKEILRDGRIKVKDVAAKVGYGDSNYFTKIFKKQTGLTPQEYKEYAAL